MINSSENIQLQYGIRVAILYGIVWFIDLLDASILNVALPHIAQVFKVDAPDAEWAIIGFLLALTITIPISSWLGDFFGVRRLFLWSQIMYIGSSIACGFALQLKLLILFRIMQGAAGGLLIPVGMALLMRTVPQSHWARIASNMNMVTLIAPAMGPLIAGYITNILGWRWLFFIKLPLSVLCLGLSYWWIHEEEKVLYKKFDWAGFITATLFLVTFFIGISAIGKEYMSNIHIIILLMIACFFLISFLWIETKTIYPLIPLSIFKFRLFTLGNLVQCCANIIFLGSTFITGLFIQEGLKFDIVTTGWILAAITPGMMIMLPFVSKLYNHVGPLPFMIPGLILMSVSLLAFLLITPQTSPLIMAFLIFCQGAASATIQTPNVMAIFCEVPSELKGIGSSIYALGKQLSASIGVALSTMVLALSMQYYHVSNIREVSFSISIPLFKYVFLVLGMIPVIALIFCFLMDNKRALRCVKKSTHLETETELGTE